MPAHLAVHTPMPLMPLTQMVADMGTIEVDKTPGGHACCFYGWHEMMDSPACLPHHVVVCHDNVSLIWLAKTLKAMGHQVVVTEADDPRDPTGDHSVLASAPILYDAVHGH